ncbi:MAG TPA: IclR family transcriptional regulator [Clostridiaceae bacterium]
MKGSTVKTNQSGVRLLDIVQVMAYNREPIKLQDLSKKLLLPAPTVYRFLLTLIETEYVKQNPQTLRYYLTLKLCEIANHIHENINIREIAYPALKNLAEKCKESACMVIEEDLMAVYIEKVEGPDNMIRGFQRIGKRAPLYCTGVGKLFLSEMEEPLLTKVIERGLKPFTKKTITGEEALKAELDKIRVQGYAMDDEECEEGARCIAAPVRDYSGKIICSVSVSGPVNRMSYEHIDEIKVYVLEAGATISKTMGYHI